MLAALFANTHLTLLDIDRHYQAVDHPAGCNSCTQVNSLQVAMLYGSVNVVCDIGNQTHPTACHANNAMHVAACRDTMRI